MVELREAQPEDARAIAEVHVASWRAAYRDLLPADVLAGLSVNARTEAWERRLSNPTARSAVLVAIADGGVRGFASFGASRDEHAGADTGELYAIYAAPEYWSQGIGRRLHDATTRLLADFGFTEAVLWVLDGNARATRFYRHFGWVEDGRLKIDSGPGGIRLRERRMHRTLPRARCT